MIKKICAKCEKEKNTTEFHLDLIKKDGRASTCKVCIAKAGVEWRKNNQDEIKKQQALRKKQWDTFLETDTRTCSVCGYDDCTEALDYHHIDPALKNFAISRCTVWAFNKKNKQLVKDEVDKCIVICKNCHAKLHFFERQVK